MKTIMKQIQSNNIIPEDFKEAARILQSGGLVAFPTETVYGLGGDGLREDSARKIYEAKGRPSDNPLIIHIGDRKDLEKLTREIPIEAKKLADTFWPGPLTMVFHKKEEVPYGTTGGLNTVAVRMPSHPIALALLKASGVCIAAPSANLSGRPSPTKASHVKDDMEGRIDMIIDGGKVGIGIESTIVDLTGQVPTILRPGFITKEMLEEVIGPIEIDKAILAHKVDENLVPKAPGMKYKHYAPKADLVIVEADSKTTIKTINQKVREAQAEGKRVGIVATEETKDAYIGDVIKIIGSREDKESIARGLYEVLREFDALEIDLIYSESFGESDFGQAIMNRLLKAAAYQVIKSDGLGEDTV